MKTGQIRVHDQTGQLRTEVTSKSTDEWFHPVSIYRGKRPTYNFSRIEYGQPVSLATYDELTDSEKLTKDPYVVPTDPKKHLSSIGIALNPSFIDEEEVPVHVLSNGKFVYDSTNAAHTYTTQDNYSLFDDTISWNYKDDIGKPVYVSSAQPGRYTLSIERALQDGGRVITIGKLADAPVDSVDTGTQIVIEVNPTGDVRGVIDSTQFALTLTRPENEFRNDEGPGVYCVKVVGPNQGVIIESTSQLRTDFERAPVAAFLATGPLDNYHNKVVTVTRLGIIDIDFSPEPDPFEVSDIGRPLYLSGSKVRTSSTITDFEFKMGIVLSTTRVLIDCRYLVQSTRFEALGTVKPVYKNGNGEEIILQGYIKVTDKKYTVLEAEKEFHLWPLLEACLYRGTFSFFENSSSSVPLAIPPGHDPAQVLSSFFTGTRVVQFNKLFLITANGDSSNYALDVQIKKSIEGTPERLDSLWPECTQEITYHAGAIENINVTSVFSVGEQTSFEGRNLVDVANSLIMIKKCSVADFDGTILFPGLIGSNGYSVKLTKENGQFYLGIKFGTLKIGDITVNDGAQLLLYVCRRATQYNDIFFNELWSPKNNWDVRSVWDGKKLVLDTKDGNGGLWFGKRTGQWSDIGAPWTSDAPDETYSTRLTIDPTASKSAINHTYRYGRPTETTTLKSVNEKRTGLGLATENDFNTVYDFEHKSIWTKDRLVANEVHTRLDNNATSIITKGLASKSLADITVTFENGDVNVRKSTALSTPSNTRENPYTKELHDYSITDQVDAIKSVKSALHTEIKDNTDIDTTLASMREYINVLTAALGETHDRLVALERAAFGSASPTFKDGELFTIDAYQYDDTKNNYGSIKDNLTPEGDHRLAAAVKRSGVVFNADIEYKDDSNVMPIITKPQYLSNYPGIEKQVYEKLTNLEWNVPSKIPIGPADTSFELKRLTKSKFNVDLIGSSAVTITKLGNIEWLINTQNWHNSAYYKDEFVGKSDRDKVKHFASDVFVKGKYNFAVKKDTETDDEYKIRLEQFYEKEFNNEHTLDTPRTKMLFSPWAPASHTQFGEVTEGEHADEVSLITSQYYFSDHDKYGNDVKDYNNPNSVEGVLDDFATRFTFLHHIFDHEDLAQIKTEDEHLLTYDEFYNSTEQLYDAVYDEAAKQLPVLPIKADYTMYAPSMPKSTLYEGDGSLSMPDGTYSIFQFKKGKISHAAGIDVVAVNDIEVVQETKKYKVTSAVEDVVVNAKVKSASNASPERTSYLSELNNFTDYMGDYAADALELENLIDKRMVEHYVSHFFGLNSTFKYDEVIQQLFNDGNFWIKSKYRVQLETMSELNMGIEGKKVSVEKGTQTFLNSQEEVVVQNDTSTLYKLTSYPINSVPPATFFYVSHQDSLSSGTFNKLVVYRYKSGGHYFVVCDQRLSALSAYWDCIGSVNDGSPTWVIDTFDIKTNQNFGGILTDVINNTLQITSFSSNQSEYEGSDDTQIGNICKSSTLPGWSVVFDETLSRDFAENKRFRMTIDFQGSHVYYESLNFVSHAGWTKLYDSFYSKFRREISSPYSGYLCTNFSDSVDQRVSFAEYQSTPPLMPTPLSPILITKSGTTAFDYTIDYFSLKSTQFPTPSNLNNSKFDFSELKFYFANNDNSMISDHKYYGYLIASLCLDALKNALSEMDDFLFSSVDLEFSFKPAALIENMYITANTSVTIPKEELSKAFKLAEIQPHREIFDTNPIEGPIATSYNVLFKDKTARLKPFEKLWPEPDDYWVGPIIAFTGDTTLELGEYYKLTITDENVTWTHKLMINIDSAFNQAIKDRTGRDYYSFYFKDKHRPNLISDVENTPNTIVLSSAFSGSLVNSGTYYIPRELLSFEKGDLRTNLTVEVTKISSLVRTLRHGIQRFSDGDPDGVFHVGDSIYVDFTHDSLENDDITYVFTNLTNSNESTPVPEGNSVILLDADIGKTVSMKIISPDEYKDSGVYALDATVAKTKYRIESCELTVVNSQTGIIHCVMWGDAILSTETKDRVVKIEICNTADDTVLVTVDSSQISSIEGSYDSNYRRSTKSISFNYDNPNDDTIKDDGTTYRLKIELNIDKFEFIENVSNPISNETIAL
jgi:hypothetical protein